MTGAMLNLANWLRSRSPNGRKAAKLYGSIVAQSRSPEFYSDLGVPDTPNGRYELLVMHMAMALHRLAPVETPNGPMSRAITEAFVSDIDDSFREMDIGDMAVPRRVKKAAAGLMERTLAYRNALSDEHSGTLSTTIASFFPDIERQDVEQLADYMLAAASLAKIEHEDEALLRGEIDFPPVLVGRRRDNGEVT